MSCRVLLSLLHGRGDPASLHLPARFDVFLGDLCLHCRNFAFGRCLLVALLRTAAVRLGPSLPPLMICCESLSSSLPCVGGSCCCLDLFGCACLCMNHALLACPSSGGHSARPVDICADQLVAAIGKRGTLQDAISSPHSAIH